MLGTRRVLLLYKVYGNLAPFWLSMVPFIEQRKFPSGSQLTILKFCIKWHCAKKKMFSWSMNPLYFVCELQISLKKRTFFYKLVRRLQVTTHTSTLHFSKEYFPTIIQFSKPIEDRIFNSILTKGSNWQISQFELFMFSDLIWHLPPSRPSVQQMHSSC